MWFYLSKVRRAWHWIDVPQQAISIGGDLAYQYASSGSLAGLALTPAEAVLASTQFGGAAQTLQPAAALADLTPRLI